tara:strand:+ start:7029 stop:8360 length:1332 start_codon:yes stop_codon:yes gene_type:complete
MPDLPEEPMTVVRLTVDSFKRLRACNLSPSPTGLVPVRGPNAQGKSSTIESMLSAFGIERPSLPITEGEHGSDIVVELANEAGETLLVVKQHWKRDSAGKAKPKLSVEAADGTPYGSPAAVMKQLVGFAADPGAFLDMKAEDQVKTILGVLGLTDALAALEDDASGLYEKRRDLGRDSDRLGKAAGALVAEVDGLPAPPTEGTIEELTARLLAAKDHNAAIDGHRQIQAAAASRGTEAAGRLELLHAEVVKLEADVQAQRDAWEHAKSELAGIGEPLDTAPIEQALAAHEESTRHDARRELMQSTVAEATAAQEEHTAVEAQLATKRGEIADLLGTVTFPVEGMSYDHETKVIMVGEIPFASASQGERLRIAAAVAMAGAPIIKAIFVREGSLLDHASQAILSEIAAANKFQLWLEIVDEPDPTTGERTAGIWIEDGEAEQVE